MLLTILILKFTFPTFQNPNFEFVIFKQHVSFKFNMLKEVTC